MNLTIVRVKALIKKLENLDFSKIMKNISKHNKKNNRYAFEYVYFS
jgi:hypothetical protein